MQLRCEKKHYIEHIIEPTRLLMTWQDQENLDRTRYTIAEIIKTGSQIKLRYLTESDDFRRARERGFDSYPAFQNIYQEHQVGIIDALIRRLPPKARTDYPQYLEGFRIKPDAQLSDFALLGYTGARLPSDGFAIINPFDDVDNEFEFLLEAAGYRFRSDIAVALNDPVTFVKEFDNNRQEDVIKIFSLDRHIGYVTRALISSFGKLLESKRVHNAVVEKNNGTPDKPTIYLYVQISKK